MQQTKTSGVSIASFVLGIVGLFCVPFLGVLSLILGIVGLRQIKRSGGATGGGGYAITGIVLGSINILFSGVFTAVMVIGAVYGEPRPTLEELPTYSSLVGEEFYGSGFHFSWDGEFYIGCSLHQFEGGMPSHMIREDMESVPIVERVHTQRDIQILSYDETILEGTDGLIYAPDVGVRMGETMLVMAHEGSLRGTMIYSMPDSDGLVYMQLEEVTRLRGLSGSAIVSGVTGTVVGVLIGGDEEAGIVGFEQIDLPGSLRGPEAASP